jgi:hypothetical protein
MRKREYKIEDVGIIVVAKHKILKVAFQDNVPYTN